MMIIPIIALFTGALPDARNLVERTIGIKNPAGSA